ncbi:hypothetical protein ACIGD1_17510 [Streptomyces sp. NPDC085612]|uniref:hypothetical protein n=1 Tax=Streptomyces sp. NPDC085612 TaxID=3365732 RepID=UPI0037CEFF5D
MDTDSARFAEAPLEGDYWLGSPVHGDTCGGCLELRRADGASSEEPRHGGWAAGSAREWMVAVSVVTVVVAAVLAVLSE